MPRRQCTSRGKAQQRPWLRMSCQFAYDEANDYTNNITPRDERVGISFIVPGSHRWIPSWTRLGCGVSAHCLGSSTRHRDCPQVPSRPFLSQFPKSSSPSTWTCITQADCKFSQAGPWRPASGGPREGQRCSAESAEQRPRDNWEALQPTLGVLEAQGPGSTKSPCQSRVLGNS